MFRNLILSLFLLSSFTASAVTVAWNGVTRANVQTWNGVASANWATWNGADSSGSTPPPAALVRYLCNEGSGTALTDTGTSGVNATHNASYVTRGSGYALSMDGSSDYGYTDSTINWGSTVMTMACKINVADFSGTGVIMTSTTDPFGGNFSWFYLAYSAGSIYVKMVDSASEHRREYAPAPATDTWVHVMCVYDTTTDDMTLYYDGAAQSTTTDQSAYSTGGIFTTSTMYMGRRESGTDYYFAGLIDNIEVYQGDVSANYTAINAQP